MEYLISIFRVLLVRSFVFFALLDLVMAMGLVGDDSADGTNASANNCAGWAANLGSYECATYCSAGDELRLGVMVMIVGVSLSNSVFV